MLDLTRSIVNRFYLNSSGNDVTMLFCQRKTVSKLPDYAAHAIYFGVIITIFYQRVPKVTYLFWCYFFYLFDLLIIHIPDISS